MPDATDAFLRSRGVDTKAFWDGANERVRSGWDQALAWLDLFLAEVRPGGSLEGLTEDDLRAFGATLDTALYPGVRTLIQELDRYRRDDFPLITLECYVISGGLRPLIEACPVVQDYFAATYASELGTDERGVVRGIKRAVTFTEKTRYLFEIHKGLPQKATTENPYLVNKHVAAQDRRVPFENMIYVGDSRTDIPCFSLVEEKGGQAIGVTDLAAGGISARRAFEDLIAPRRTTFGVHAPRYDASDQLGQIIRLAVRSLAGRITSRLSNTSP